MLIKSSMVFRDPLEELRKLVERLRLEFGRIPLPLQNQLICAMRTSRRRDDVWQLESSSLVQKAADLGCYSPQSLRQKESQKRKGTTRSPPKAPSGASV